MSDTQDWTQRVDQMTAATAHEQLRAVVRDAQDMLRNFSDAASEQGGLLLDAQRELEVSLERRMSEVSAELSGSLAALRSEMASIQRAPADGASDFEALRVEAFGGLAALGEELDAETKRLREELTSRMDQIDATLTTMNEAQRRLEARLDAAQRSSDERFGSILAAVERSAGMEERAAARMVDLLASAFARLRDDQSPGGPALRQVVEKTSA